MAAAYSGARPLRADAERNRARIVAAARAAFADRGLEVPLEEIAAEAGVGIATLYRPLRPDFVPQDLVLLLLMANAGVVAARRGPSSTSRRKKPASRASRRAVRRTTRSPRSYSSVRAPSIITCARCSASST